jgi:hypothetical protein
MKSKARLQVGLSTRVLTISLTYALCLLLEKPVDCPLSPCEFAMFVTETSSLDEDCFL